jgi:uncharacterized protein
MGKVGAVRLTRDEARGLMLAAQGLLHPPAAAPGLNDLRAAIERLGVVQVDTINVAERSQYLVLWSRLGPYDPALLDALISPHRAIFEYWSHAASLVPMADYAFYRPRMLRAAEWVWKGDRDWLAKSADVLESTLEMVRQRGPMASADFERPSDGRRPAAWDWYGVKESRRALQILWTLGDLMVHSRRGGQKVYDLRERVLAEAFGKRVPRDDKLPSPEECTAHFVRRTVNALGVVAPSWLWDYFRHERPNVTSGARRVTAAQALDACVRQRLVVPGTIDGIKEPVYVAHERLADLERTRAGERPTRTTLLSPFDSLIWDRARAKALWDYDVCFEAYVVPEKRRYGYYCLAILHRGRIVGRLDPKMDRTRHRLQVHAVYLEPGVDADEVLLEGVAGALRELGAFLGARAIDVARSDPDWIAAALQERLALASLPGAG